MSHHSFVLLIAAALVMPIANADDPGTATGRPSAMPETEYQSRRWLDLQKSGNQAGSKYTIPGQIATLSYRRYLNSFKYPIPRMFSFGGSSTSGITGGGASGGLSDGGLGYGSGTNTGLSSNNDIRWRQSDIESQQRRLESQQRDIESQQSNIQSQQSGIESQQRRLETREHLKSLGMPSPP